jgi:1,4-alpha-glucan branching enzyme
LIAVRKSPAYLAVVLHAHLPYVRHPEHDPFFEEDWFFEAITETYLPLLALLEGLARDAVPACLTITLTPPLCHMLRDPLLKKRYSAQLDRLVEFAHREVQRTRVLGGAPERLARFYVDRLEGCREAWHHRWKGDLVGAFDSFARDGFLEIITCAATHGFLPLMEVCPEAVRAQVLIGRDHYREQFGRDPVGIWLPECAYSSALNPVLQEANLRWFAIDSHGLMFANPRPRYAIYAPCFTPSGCAVFGRDRDSSRQVWSAEEGYPGDPAYRDFYRDAGFDLPMTELQAVLRDGHRRFTGLKYHRITGATAEKDWYDRRWALAAVEHHAAHFLRARQTQMEALRAHMNVPTIVLSPFDAELFGHWWFEGPEWLNAFLRKAAAAPEAFELTTPARYLAEHHTLQVLEPSASSWGHKGYWEVWLEESNAWIYPHLHAAARRMTQMARRHVASTDPYVERVLAQAARELLLAQSSDWAFLMKTGTAREYATRRTEVHIHRFNRLYEHAIQGVRDEPFLANCEARDNIFPNLNWRYYA